MSFEIALSRRQSRALALALAAVPLFAAIALAASLGLSWSAHHARVAALTAERDAYRKSISQEPALDAALKRLDSAKKVSGYFFAGGESSAAAAKVRSDIGSIVSRNGATIARNDVELAAAGDDSPVQLRASVSFTADIKSLTQILHQLRQERPLLFVTQIVVHSQATAPLTTPNRLQVDLLAEAYLDTP